MDQLQTFQFPTQGRSTFYLITSRHLVNRKITFKAPGRDRGRRSRVTKKKGNFFSFFFLWLNFDEESIGDGLQVQKILLLPRNVR